jgi:hypothetical protein
VLAIGVCSPAACKALKLSFSQADTCRMSAATPLAARDAEFGQPIIRKVLCQECLDTGIAGGSAWTAAVRCEECHGPTLLTRLLRRTPLGEILAAPPRTIREA